MMCLPKQFKPWSRRQRSAVITNWSQKNVCGECLENGRGGCWYLVHAFSLKPTVYYSNSLLFFPQRSFCTPKYPKFLLFFLRDKSNSPPSPGASPRISTSLPVNSNNIRLTLEMSANKPVALSHVNRPGSYLDPWGAIILRVLWKVLIKAWNFLSL